MQALILFGFVLYYAAVAITLNWWLRRNSLWFTSFLAVVLSQTILFGGDYLYRGYWETWNDITLVMSSTMCIAIVAAVAVAFHIRRSKSANAPT
jgi:cation transport ATPase